MKSMVNACSAWKSYLHEPKRQKLHGPRLWASVDRIQKIKKLLSGSPSSFRICKNYSNRMNSSWDLWIWNFEIFWSQNQKSKCSLSWFVQFRRPKSEEKKNWSSIFAEVSESFGIFGIAWVVSEIFGFEKSHFGGNFWNFCIQIFRKCSGKKKYNVTTSSMIQLTHHT